MQWSDISARTNLNAAKRSSALTIDKLRCNKSLYSQSHSVYMKKGRDCVQRRRVSSYLKGPLLQRLLLGGLTLTSNRPLEVLATMNSRNTPLSNRNTDAWGTAGNSLERSSSSRLIFKHIYCHELFVLVKKTPNKYTITTGYQVCTCLCVRSSLNWFRMKWAADLSDLSIFQKCLLETEWLISYQTLSGHSVCNSCVAERPNWWN